MNRTPNDVIPEPSKPLVGNGLCAAPGQWAFGGRVPHVFDDHVRRSIPGYAAAHRTALEIAARHLSTADVAYDLGCATGTLTHALAARHPETRIVGIDLEPSMLVEAERRATHSNLHFLQGSLVSFPFVPCKFVACLYTLHFVPPRERSLALGRIARALEPRGALVLFEKVHARDPERQRSWQRAYTEFKQTHGFTADEITSKARSLDGVLVPLSRDQNEALLRNAGFTRIRPLSTHLCFQGWLAEK